MEELRPIIKRFKPEKGLRFGSLLGLLYGFADGFVSAALIGYIYNKLVK